MVFASFTRSWSKIPVRPWKSHRKSQSVTKRWKTRKDERRKVEKIEKNKIGNDDKCDRKVKCIIMKANYTKLKDGCARQQYRT